MAVSARPTPRSGLSPFAARIDESLRRISRTSGRFLAACSGGPDSVALVHALREIAGHRGIHVEIGHVNHRLRGRESGSDQRFVEDLGRRLGWRVHVLSRPIPRSGGNLEEKAREFLKDPWAARDAYIDVVLNRHGDNLEAWFGRHASRELGEAEHRA